MAEKQAAMRTGELTPKLVRRFHNHLGLAEKLFHVLVFFFAVDPHFVRLCLQQDRKQFLGICVR